MVQYKNKLYWHCSKKSCSVNSANIDRSTCNLVLTTPLENNLVKRRTELLKNCFVSHMI